MTVPVTWSQLQQLAPHALQHYRDALQASAPALAAGGIDRDALRICHFFAQSLTETGALSVLTENLNYSAVRLCKVWPRHFPTLASARPFAHDPEKLGNYIYGQIKGAELGNTEPGDGYKFRGRGFLQITGRAAYERYGEQAGVDLAADPDLACDPRYSLLIAALEWKDSSYLGESCNALADLDDIVGVTYAINGGQNGIDDRRLWLARSKAIWLAQPGPPTA